VSISPVSDIVFDVAMAADPAKYHAAAAKLLTGRASVSSNCFDLVLRNTSANMPHNANSFTAPSLAAAKPLNPPDKAVKAYKGFEQLVLKNLVETLLPKNSSVLFGSSTAGEVWRSMLADHLASEIGKTVELGTTRRKVALIDSGSREGTLNRHLSSSDAPLHNPV
jgi:peptidoglycan hydrolase FlgJ